MRITNRLRHKSSYNSGMAAPHIPVLVKEVVDRLITKRDGIYVDGTVGAGGHSQAVLERLSADAVLLGVDADTA
ncbi:MAG TPA: 16S rRNA (cytosine(1402)-N(4))-methyltransferase, partial [bacterium]|nr:16S rRNA (cytosine(1402)-N(4))-methyltransferase [bacterium]